MVSVDVIYKYFPNLTPIQQKQFALLYDVYKEWNDQINVVSRKDFDQFYERHVLHSLGIAKVLNFQPGTEVLDVGTGGGFPGIPLAIALPEVTIISVDSVGKKINFQKHIKRLMKLKRFQSSPR